MPYLYCEKHGRAHEAHIIEQQDKYRQADETVLVTAGTLVSGPWQCDKCNASLRPANTAVLVSAFPSHCREDLCGYDFGYERQYFAMTKGDTATVYGAEWPDDSIRTRRNIKRTKARQPQKPLCALDFQRPRSDG
jgi:hypothetical protein